MAIDDVGPGRASLSMTVTDIMTNGHGICHGGYIFTLADSAFAYACNSYGDRVVAAQAAVSFLAPAQLGDRLTASARETHRKGKSGIFDVSVSNQSGEVIAEFRGHSRVIPGSHLPENLHEKG